MGTAPKMFERGRTRERTCLWKGTAGKNPVPPTRPTLAAESAALQDHEATEGPAKERHAPSEHDPLPDGRPGIRVLSSGGDPEVFVARSRGSDHHCRRGPCFGRSCGRVGVVMVVWPCHGFSPRRLDGGFFGVVVVAMSRC